LYGAARSVIQKLLRGEELKERNRFLRSFSKSSVDGLYLFSVRLALSEKFLFIFIERFNKCFDGSNSISAGSEVEHKSRAKIKLNDQSEEIYERRLAGHFFA
jgi:hypothetical protein